MSKKLPQFKRKKLSWTEPKSELSISELSDDQLKNVYETTYIDLTLNKTSEQRLPGLCISTNEISVNLPEDWNSFHVEDLLHINLTLEESDWKTIVVCSDGTQRSVALSLRVIQFYLNKTDKEHVKIVLVKDADSTEDSGLLGLARTSTVEYPDLNVQCVVARQKHYPKAIEIASCTDIEREIYIDENEDLSVPRLKQTLIRKSKEFGIKNDSTYVISGGLGALGLTVANALVESGARYLVLLSRTQYSEETLPEEVRKLKGKAQVLCLSCDVSKRENVHSAKNIVAETGFPAVAGLIHTAGILSDGTIGNQVFEDFEKSFDIKVRGAEYLKGIFSPNDFSVYFSSAAGLFGSLGQASYSSANAALDYLVEKWKKAGENAISIQWGAWAEEGMAVRNDAVKRAVKRAESEGFGSISNSTGIEYIKALIASGISGSYFVSPMDWEKVKLDNPLISNFKLKDEENSNSTVDGTDSKQNKNGKSDIRRTIRKAVWEAVGDPVEDNVVLMDNGLNSLGSMSLRNRIATDLSVTLPSAFAMECPDINSMVRYVSALSNDNQNSIETAKPKKTSSLPILVIGAGVGGLSFARQLVLADLPVMIMEKGSDVGGVWNTLANTDSKLQIDSPAYDFDSTSLPFPNDYKWEKTFPDQPQILSSSRNLANELAERVMFNTEVLSVKKISEQEYSITFRQDGETKEARYSGVVSMTGGLHKPRQHSFPNESDFLGHVGLGVSNDTPLEVFNNANVVIVGHGAFALENMRTALENGASHVTILCRRRNLVLSTFCNWMLNSCKGVMPVTDVMEIMRPFYKACGIDIETLPSFVKNESGELMLDQTTVPPGSDLFFLAQMVGKLTVIENEVELVEKDCIVAKDGTRLKADVFLKCLGSETDQSLLKNIFGSDMEIKGLWVNGDPNLFTYNDGAQVPRKVKSLLCASYAFFVQTFAKAYIHFRDLPETFEKTINRIMTESHNNTIVERIFIELWDFIEPSKKIVSQRTKELLPFDRFQVERENEWKKYGEMLGASQEQISSIWSMLSPTLSILNRREPSSPVELRNTHSDFGNFAVFAPKRRKVLFLPGQGTNARLARSLLERTGWLARTDLEFVVPDAPYELPAFTNEQQLQQVGLDGLVQLGVYEKSAIYREWRAGFETLWGEFHGGEPKEPTIIERKQWDYTLQYLKYIATTYGPFEGIAGFCEGAAVASVALNLEAKGEDYGLKGTKFFIAMSPWQSPMHIKDRLFKKGHELDIPTLQIVGDNDMPVFIDAAPIFSTNYEYLIEYHHSGQHVYPPLNQHLNEKLDELIGVSEMVK